jgi:hypothetical protein
VIKLVVDGGESLPAGVDSVLALISSDAALATFEDGLDPGQLQAAIAEVSDDTSLLSGYSAGRVPSGYAIIFPGAPGTIRVGVGGQSLLTLTGANTGATAGGGSLVGADFANDAGSTWTIDNNQLVVTLEEPRPGAGAVLIPGCADRLQLMDIQGALTGLRIERLQDGSSGVDFLHVTELFRVDTYVDQDPDNGCSVPASLPMMEFDYRALGYKDGAGELPYAAGEALGTQMLTDYHSTGTVTVVPQHWGASLFDFDVGTAPAGCGLPNGGSVVRNTSRQGKDLPSTSWSADFTVTVPFCWVNDAGHLRVRVADPDDGVVREFTYRRYQSDTRKGEGVMVVLTDCQLDGSGAVLGCDGPLATTFGMASRVDGSLVFTTANMPGEWRSGFDISIFQPSLATKVGFFYLVYPQPDAAHQSAQKSVTYDANGNPVTLVNLNYLWGVEDGRWEARAYRENGSPCFTPSPTCTLNRRREWVPVARDGDRIYVLERLYQRVFGAPTLVAERPNFWDVGPLP